MALREHYCQEIMVLDTVCGTGSFLSVFYWFTFSEVASEGNIPTTVSH